MYDARNERHEFVGDDRDQAVQKATDFFRVGLPLTVLVYLLAIFLVPVFWPL